MSRVYWDQKYRAEIEKRLVEQAAEITRLTAGLESIERLCRYHDGVEEVYSPGGMQAAIILKGSNRPMERLRKENDALRAELADLRKERG